jgi:hypothetical protein
LPRFSCLFAAFFAKKSRLRQHWDRLQTRLPNFRLFSLSQRFSILPAWLKKGPFRLPKEA